MIFQFHIIRYNRKDPSKELMQFRREPDIDTKLLSRWVGSSYGTPVGQPKPSHSDPWTSEPFHPTLMKVWDGLAPDFIKTEKHPLTLASMRAIEIMERHGVNMQTFPASVQLEENQPPVSDAYMLYKLLDMGPVIDLEKTETRKRGVTTYFRNPVPAESFLQSNSVMRRDEHYKTYIFIKKPLRDAFEKADLLGWDADPFHSLERWFPFEQEDQKQNATSNTPPTPGANNNIQATELTADDLQEVRQSQRAAAEDLKLDLKDDPKRIVETIAKAVENLSKQALSEEGAITYAVGYGCLYDEQIVRQYGWVWRMVRYPGGGDPVLAVLPPDYAYVVHPMGVVHKLLTDPDATNTLILLFNLLGAEDRLPKPRQKNGFRGLM